MTTQEALVARGAEQVDSEQEPLWMLWHARGFVEVPDQGLSWSGLLPIATGYLGDINMFMV